MQSIIQAENITKRFGDRLLFSNISLNINSGEKIAILGLNGSGKTTLLKILSGHENIDDGKISKARDINIAYLLQEPELNEELTVINAVFYSNNDRIKYLKEYRNATESEDITRIQKASETMDRFQLWDYEYLVKQILTQLKITEFDAKINTLSGGQKKRVALAATLIDDFDLLILDEPTNHLDLDMIEWLEDFLFQTKASVLFVTHDRYFLERICTQIIEIDNKEIYTYEGNFSSYLEKRSKRLENQMSNTEKAKNVMRTELDWIRRMPKARTSKPKYRIDAFYELKKAAQNTHTDPEIKILVKSERLGKKVLEIDNLHKGFDNKKLIKDFSIKISPNDKIGIIGKNGSGKTTLLNLLANELSPDKGDIVWGETVKYAYYKQDGIKFKDTDRPIDIIQAISENISLSNGRSVSASGFLQLFLFSPELQYSLIKKLSGGEKRRLYLCSILVQRPNVLIFDEPTNDLDILTLQVLEQYLEEFSGVIFIVSHDRYFMDKIVDHILVFNDDGNIKDYPGNYTVYRTQFENISKESPKADTKKSNQHTISKKNNSKTRNKLSFKDKFEMEQLEVKITSLNEQKSIIETKLNSGKSDASEMQKLSEQYAENIEELNLAEFRWLELSEKDGL